MFKQPESDTRIEGAINRVLAAMQEYSPESVDYATLVQRLSELHALKVNNTKSRMSKDTIATVLANIAGILLILHYERAEIVGSKALAFVMKAR
jgi:hypothetical protein